MGASQPPALKADGPPPLEPNECIGHERDEQREGDPPCGKGAKVVRAADSAGEGAFGVDAAMAEEREHAHARAKKDKEEEI